MSALGESAPGADTKRWIVLSPSWRKLTGAHSEDESPVAGMIGREGQQAEQEKGREKSQREREKEKGKTDEWRRR